MFRIQDTVRYSTTGICTITDRVVRSSRGVSEEFFVLRPVYDARSTLFVPVNNPALLKRMLPVYTDRQAEELLCSVPELPECWIPEENERRQEYRRRMIEGDRPGMAAVIKTLILRERRLQEMGKKLRLDDERCLRETERLLYGECAFALSCTPEEFAAKMQELLK